jgi:pyridoxal phosphate enzyme (YggS family)
MDLPARIADNLREVRQRIAQAAARAGRQAEEITLVGVTKYVDATTAQALVDAGHFDLGESRPQELWSKAAALPDPRIRWHVIGHLQRNKARRTLPHVALLHSLDSLTLAEGLSAEAQAIARRVPVLLEIKIAADATKHGIAASDARSALHAIAALPGLQVQGLMCMASLEGGPDAARRDFAALRTLRDDLAKDCPNGASLAQLSMGMSGDYEIAIEEGATHVRVGSALFEGVIP